MSLLQKCLGSEKKEQFLLLGLDGAGKTTLFWRLKFKDWKRDDLLKDIEKMKQNVTQLKLDVKIKGDPGFHYEEFTKSGILKYGMWDVPGNDQFRLLWPTFYRYIRISAVIFVVDALEAQETEASNARVEQTRTCLLNLLAEDELRNAAFVVLLNNKKYKAFQKEFVGLQPEGYEKVGYDTEKATLEHMLGLHEIAQQEHNRRRFKIFVMDIAELPEGESSDDWQKVLEEVRKILIAMATH